MFETFVQQRPSSLQEFYDFGVGPRVIALVADARLPGDYSEMVIFSSGGEILFVFRTGRHEVERIITLFTSRVLGRLFVLVPPNKHSTCCPAIRAGRHASFCLVQD